MVRLKKEEVPVYDDGLVMPELFHKDIKKDILKVLEGFDTDATTWDLVQALTKAHPKKYQGVQTTDIKVACVQLVAEGEIVDR